MPSLCTGHYLPLYQQSSSIATVYLGGWQDSDSLWVGVLREAKRRETKTRTLREFEVFGLYSYRKNKK